MTLIFVTLCIDRGPVQHLNLMKNQKLATPLPHPYQDERHFHGSGLTQVFPGEVNGG